MVMIIIIFHFIKYVFERLFLWLILHIDKTFMDFYEAAVAGCNEKCTFGRDCILNIDIERIGKLRSEFWGLKDDVPKLPKERMNSIESIFSKMAEKDLVNVIIIVFGI